MRHILLVLFMLVSTQLVMAQSASSSASPVIGAAKPVKPADPIAKFKEAVVKLSRLMIDVTAHLIRIEARLAAIENRLGIKTGPGIKTEFKMGEYDSKTGEYQLDKSRVRTPSPRFKTRVLPGDGLEPIPDDSYTVTFDHDGMEYQQLRFLIGPLSMTTPKPTSYINGPVDGYCTIYISAGKGGPIHQGNRFYGTVLRPYIGKQLIVKGYDVQESRGRILNKAGQLVCRVEELQYVVFSRQFITLANGILWPEDCAGTIKDQDVLRSTFRATTHQLGLVIERLTFMGKRANLTSMFILPGGAPVKTIGVEPNWPFRTRSPYLTIPIDEDQLPRKRILPGPSDSTEEPQVTGSTTKF